jgi:hypothetical protein
MKIKRYRFITLYTEIENDIIFNEYPKNLKVDLAVAKEIVGNRLEFAEGEKHYLVGDLTNVKSVTSEAKAYLLDPNYGVKDILGAAFIAGNPVAALIANVFIKPSKNFPSKFFSKKTDALKWITELKGSTI